MAATARELARPEIGRGRLPGKLARRRKLPGSGKGSSAHRSEEIGRLLPELEPCWKLPRGLPRLLAPCTVSLGRPRAELRPRQLCKGRLPSKLALLKIGLGRGDLTAGSRTKVAGTVNWCKLGRAAFLGKVPTRRAAVSNPAFLAAIVFIAVHG